MIKFLSKFEGKNYEENYSGESFQLLKSESSDASSNNNNNNASPTLEFSITLFPPSDDTLPQAESPEENEIKNFMISYVNTLFANPSNLTLEQKSTFGSYVQTESGQTWFSRIINAQRCRWRCVSESTFYSLIQHFAIVLFECANLDFFPPAKTLMNMCFTFYHEVQVPGCEPFREYLSTHLKNQPIWQSLRFWNAAFFDALQCARVQRPVLTRTELTTCTYETIVDDDQYLENLTFGQLGTFICNMHAFGLDKKLCEDFLQKQYTIASLPPSQEKMLQDHLNKLYEQTESFF